MSTPPASILRQRKFTTIRRRCPTRNTAFVMTEEATKWILIRSTIPLPHRVGRPACRWLIPRHDDRSVLVKRQPFPVRLTVRTRARRTLPKLRYGVTSAGRAIPLVPRPALLAGRLGDPAPCGSRRRSPVQRYDATLCRHLHTDRECHLLRATVAAGCRLAGSTRGLHGATGFSRLTLLASPIHRTRASAMTSRSYRCQKRGPDPVTGLELFTWADSRLDFSHRFIDPNPPVPPVPGPFVFGGVPPVGAYTYTWVAIW